MLFVDVLLVCMKEKRKRKRKYIMVLLYCLYCVECHGLGPPGSREGEMKMKRVMVSILLGSITGLACALVCACLLRCVFIYMNRTPILNGPVVFSPQISPKALQSALSNETQLLGPGPGSGYYYMTLLEDNGFQIAVKKLQQSPHTHNHTHRRRRRRRIQRELEILASLRHRHVMALRAYYWESESSRFCLVYDYIPSGSLQDAMNRARANELRLGWDARLRIAVGIIKGLHYLHFTCTPTICHYNLKPSNVMLDPDFHPTLADSGLANIIIPTFHHHSPYYYAPECCPNFSIYTEKSDIYSFGVILGILLTGRDPSDPLFGQAAATISGSGSGSGSRSSSSSSTNSSRRRRRRRGDMGMWFRQLLENGDAREALDKSLLGEEMEEDEMLMAVRIAAVCLSDMPADRPSSHELVPMLTQLHSF